MRVWWTTWVPKFLPTTQFQDSAKEIVIQIIEGLTPVFVELALDGHRDLLLFLVVVKCLHDDLKSGLNIGGGRLTCLAESCMACSMSETRMCNFTIV